MNRRLPVILSVLLSTNLAFADDFDRLEGPVLTGLTTNANAKSHDRLSLSELGTQSSILAGIRTPLVLVKTDQGNFARLLISLGFRKSATSKDALLPILVIERFDTFEAGPATSKLARGKDVVLFDGFHFDLDSGMVVPEGQGGDIVFTTKGDKAPALAASKGTTLYTLEKSPLGPAATGGLTAGRGVAPTDFNGRFQLVADGQWSGRLDVAIDGERAVTGRFRSDQTGGSYKVTGELAADAPNRILFSVELPRTRLEFDGRIWTDGKGAMAGTVSLLDHLYGFVAFREGGRLVPEGEDPRRGVSQGPAPERAVISLRTDETQMDGQHVSVADLPKRFSELKVRSLVIRAAKDVPASTVLEVLKSANEAGILSIQLIPQEEQSAPKDD